MRMLNEQLWTGADDVERHERDLEDFPKAKKQYKASKSAKNKQAAGKSSQSLAEMAEGDDPEISDDDEPARGKQAHDAGWVTVWLPPLSFSS